MLGLAATVAVLASCSLAAHGFLGAVPEHRLRAVREVAMRFDLDRENTLPEWFTSTLLVACAGLLALIARRVHHCGGSFSRHWCLLAVAFVYLSIDESVGLHEILIVPLRRRLDAGGIFYFGWVVVALPMVAIMFVAYLGFLRNLVKHTRWLFVAAGTLYVGGALGMEMIGGLLVEQGGYYTTPYTIAMTIEESCEMLGASLFLCALLTHIGHLGKESSQSLESVAD